MRWQGYDWRDYLKPKEWFAWYPVRLVGTTTWVWLEHIWFKRECGYIGITVYYYDTKPPVQEEA